MPLLSDRAQKTGQVVVMPAQLEDRTKVPAGLYRLGLLLTCAWILTFFGALVIAFFWRARTMAFWEPIPLPKMLWVSTGILLASSAVFEKARRLYRKGGHHIASRLLLVTACGGAAFLASQLTAWHELMERGAYLSQNPFSSFIYIFTAIHGLHLIGGLVALSVVLFRRSKRRELVDVVCYYWHFMGFLWLVLLGTLLSA
jgi:cytochrome c oxidase subunit III